MFQLMNLRKKECHQQAFHTKIHQLTTNRIPFHIHLHHLETEVPQVICNQVYLLLYQNEQVRPKKYSTTIQYFHFVLFHFISFVMNNIRTIHTTSILIQVPKSASFK